MKRSSLIIIAIFLLLVSALIVFPGCEKKDTGKAEVDKTEDNNQASTTPDSSGTTPGVNSSVTLYFLKGETLTPYVRQIRGGAPEALNELLAGPSPDETAQGFQSAIPEGVKVNSFQVEGGKAKVDFSGELLSYGGGSARVEAIINQITSTVKENDPSIGSVEITVNGVPASQCLQP